MSRDQGTRHVPGYDLFKLIVAILLAILFFILLQMENDRKFAALETTKAPLFATATPLAVVPTELSSVPEPSPTTTAAVAETPTAVPESVPTDTPVPSPVPASQSNLPASDPGQCPSQPTRIQSGVKVKVMAWLYLRTGPGLGYPILRTNRPGAVLEVIGGPYCTQVRKKEPSAYLWWNVRAEDGREGWSAEAPLNSPSYFLEPVP